MGHPPNYRTPGGRRMAPAIGSTATPRFTISILAFNRLDVTRPCLESVMRHSSSCELILTDNGSTDGVARYFDSLAQRFPNVRAVHNRENLGFQEPNRRALEMARGEFFVLLNNDTRVSPNWLTALRAPFADPKMAITGPAGMCCEIRDDFRGAGGGRLEYIEGSCLMVRTSIAREHGLFAPYLEFAYGEDADLSLRLRELGYEIATVGTRLHHVGSATAKQVPRVREYEDRNHAVLRDRWAHYLKVRTMDYPIILRRRASLGDVLLTTPIIHELKRRRPLSPIVVVTDCPEIFDRNPDVHAAARQHDDPRALVIDLDMAYENAPGISYLDAYAAKAGITLQDRQLRYYPAADAKNRAEAITGRLGPRFVAIHPEASWVSRTWPAERWASLIARLRAIGRQVVLVGAGSPGILPADIDLRGQLSISETAAVLARASLFVGIDSFPMHLAMSQGTPVVALFGVSTPEMVFSQGPAIGVHVTPEIVPCAGARHRVAGAVNVECDGACMRAITLEMVTGAIERFAPLKPVAVA